MCSMHMPSAHDLMSILRWARGSAVTAFIPGKVKTGSEMRGEAGSGAGCVEASSRAHADIHGICCKRPSACRSARQGQEQVVLSMRQSAEAMLRQCREHRGRSYRGIFSLFGRLICE